MANLNKIITGDEQVLVQRRQHWTALVSEIIKFVRNVFAVGVVGAVLQSMAGTGPLGDLLQAIPGLGLVKATIAPVTAPIYSLIPGWVPWTIGLAIVGVSMVNLLGGVLAHFGSRSIITNKRVIQLKGLLRGKPQAAPLDTVNEVALKQSVFGKMLGYGTLNIATAGGAAVQRIKHIGNPLAFKGVMLHAKQQAATSLTGAQYSIISGVPSVAERINKLNALYKDGLVSTEEYVAKRRNLIDLI